MYNEAAGTKVTPLSKIARNIDVSGGYTAGSIGVTEGIMYTHLANLIGDKFDESAERLAMVVARHGYKTPPKPESMMGAVTRLLNTQGI